jgi:hypothetical protein
MNLFIGIKRHSTIELEGRERKNLSKLVSLIAVDVVEKLEFAIYAAPSRFRPAC